MKTLASILLIILFSVTPFMIYYVWFHTKEAFEPLGYGIMMLITAIIILNLLMWAILKIIYNVDIIGDIFWDNEV